MDNSIEIIPAILTDSPQEAISLLQKADGIVKRIHIDIIDGVFADNRTIEPSVFNEVDHGLLIDFHLMVNEPVNWIEKCARAGGSCLIGHIEMMTDASEFIAKVTEAGLSPGLAFDVDTPIDNIEERLLTDADVVLVMSVPAGLGGQEFHPEVIDKIQKLDKIRKTDTSPFKVCDDGGVSLKNIETLREAGIDKVVIGQRIFQGDLEKNISAFMGKAHGL